MEIIVLIEGVHNDTGPIKGTTIVNSIDPMCSSVTLLKSKKNILIDTGYRGYEDEIIASLKEQKLTPADIDVVINTHSHLDHCYNNYLFRNAKVIYGRSVLSPKKWDVVSEITIPGLNIMETPGHFPDHLSILVKINQSYIITGDALREDIIRDKALWKTMNDEYVKNAKRILAFADVIIPGHGRIIQEELLDELKRIIASRE
jgi:glyoxylase-like metal-dependent hydrolase (beta-lactamase superfamily II)